MASEQQTERVDLDNVQNLEQRMEAAGVDLDNVQSPEQPRETVRDETVVANSSARTEVGLGVVQRRDEIAEDNNLTDNKPEEQRKEEEKDMTHNFGCFLFPYPDEDTSIPEVESDAELFDAAASEADSPIGDPLQLWMLSVPTRFEGDIANTLQEAASKKMAAHPVRVHYRPFLPRRIYIEAPALLQVEEVLKLTAHDSLLERAVQIIGVDRRFLQRYDSFTIPDINNIVRIRQPGLYDQDIGLVVDKLAGDLICILVIPRLNNGKKRKRGRPPPSVLSSEVLWGLPIDDDGFYQHGTRRFTYTGLECLVAPCSHGIELDPTLSTEEVLLVDPVFFPHVDTTNFDDTGIPLEKWVRRIMRKEAAVCKGHMKGWQGPLIEINRHSVKIECGGRHPPWVVASLGEVVLLDEPTKTLDGRKLPFRFVGRSLIRPEPPRPRTPPYASTEPFIDPFEATAGDCPETSGKMPPELGHGAFLRDDLVCANLDDIHIWVGFTALFEGGKWMKRNACTPRPNRFADKEGSCSDDEVCLITTDHRGQSLNKRVKLRHLVPANPRKKGDRVVVIFGEDKGRTGIVEKCQTKSLQAVVLVDGGGRCTYPFSCLCRISSDLS